jgi:hypothetical protein
MQRDFHATRLLSIKMSGLTAMSFCDLGDMDGLGRVYQNQLDLILIVPMERKTIEHIQSKLRELAGDRMKQRSISRLLNVFEPLCQQGIIRDDGTDISEMLHHPRDGGTGRSQCYQSGNWFNQRQKKESRDIIDTFPVNGRMSTTV